MRGAPALVLALAVATVGAAGCGAPHAQTDMEPPPDGGMTLTLGTLGPDGGYQPLTDGQDVTLVEGAQGGFHVWMQFKVDDPRAMHVEAVRMAHRRDGGELVLRAMGPAYDIVGMPGGGPWESTNPVPMFMCPSPLGIRVVDEAIVYDVTFTDDAQEPVAHGTITLVPRCPTDPMKLDFCMKICTG